MPLKRNWENNMSISDIRNNGLNPLSYMGVQSYSPANFIKKPISPTPTDSQNFTLGTIWLNTITEQVWILVSLAQNIAVWAEFASGSGSVLSLTSNSGGAVFSLAGNINVMGDGTTLVGVGDPATNTITFTALNSGTVTSVSDGNNITITGTPTVNPTVNVSGTTNHSLLLGNSTGSINNLGVATNGQLPIGSTGADPVLATLTAGSGISISNGAGTITISATGGGGVINNIYAQRVIAQVGSAQSSTNTFFSSFSNSFSAGTDSEPTVAPISGVFKGLAVDVSSNGSTANTTITFYQNGSPTSLQVTVTALSTGVFQDTTHSISVAQGDALSIVVSAATTSTWTGIISWVYTA
jgi:hypothetical protein